MSEEKKAAAEQAEEIKEETQAETKETESKAEEAPKADKKTEKKEKKARKKEDERVSALEAEQAELNDKYLRICAEYDNYRRRSQKEKSEIYADVKADTVQKFLPVYDNLERALRQGTEDEAYRKGVELIMSQFESTLEKLGVTAVECLGEKFDPTLHNAVMHVDDEDKGENEIVEVFQKGFKLGDKVIRFAMVKVAN